MPVMNLISTTETITDGNCGSGFSREARVVIAFAAEAAPTMIDIYRGHGPRLEHLSWQC